MINLVLFGFVTQILILAILGIPCTLDMKCVPRMVKELFCYGKASESYKHNLNVLVKAIQIPKRYVICKKSHINLIFLNILNIQI